MARRSGTNKGVEEKRRSLPIYDHYTLSPGKTKSHHPEAKCNHCHKEFVCGSKQRLIRHLRKCNNISNPEQIIAETLNTLARNSATGQLNHSILEASNLLPSQIQQQQQLHPTPNHHHPFPHSSSSPISSSNTTNSNITINNVNQHNTSGSSNNDTMVGINTSNGLSTQQLIPATTMRQPAKRPQKRGRKPANQSLATSSPTIHVTTGLDGKTRFTPASQLPANVTTPVQIPPSLTGPITQRGVVPTYTPYPTTPNVVPTAALGIVRSNGSHHPISGHLTPTNHLDHSTPGYKFNSDLSDKAYLKLVLTRNLALSLCDTKEFQLWVKTFANDYKPPNSINLIAQNLKTEAQTARQRISNILVKASKKTINLELQSWPDSHHGHPWFAVIANIDHKRFLVSLRDIRQRQKQHQSVVKNESNQIEQTSMDIDNQVPIKTHELLSGFIDDSVKKVGSDRINCLVFSEEDSQLRAKVSQILYATHPSIITYQCWWHFTNLLCSDIIEQNLLFQDVIRKSNRIIEFLTKKPYLSQNFEKFNPFIGVGTGVNARKNDQRWYSHLVCYLLEYLKNNNEAIIKALQTYTGSSASSLTTTSITNQSQEISSDNNNNSSGIEHLDTQIQAQQILSLNYDPQLDSIKTMVMSNDYWSNLNSVLNYLKPIHEIVALSSIIVPNNNINSSTPQASPIVTGNLYLSQYMSWFLNYGKTLFEGWRENPDNYNYQLIKQFISRFVSSQENFKLLLAAYLLDPKHRCAYMTQYAKNVAIEEILNIASEFMPEESDGHTIFDQWKLYLVREEPYDVVYDETRTSPLEWWHSLPCAESIRRVALRILRLKAFASLKPEALFSQLHLYKQETNSSVDNSTFEDLAVMRYFYDFEDKIGQQPSNANNYHNTTPTSSAAHCNSNTNITNYQDRAQVGILHNNHSQETNNSLKYLPSGPIQQSNDGIINHNSLAPEVVCSQSLNDSSRNSTMRMNSGSDKNVPYTNDSPLSEDVVVVQSYMGDNNHTINHYHQLSRSSVANSNLSSSVQSNFSIEDLSGYKFFNQYVDYNIMGVQLVEEPAEKKKRKWTAQEILSKCQSNHQNNNNNIKNC